MKRSLFLLLCISIYFPLDAQENFTLSGYVRDMSSGEAMIGATIYVPAVQSGAYTNSYGFYSLSLPAGTYQVIFRFVGYQADTLEIALSQNIPYNVELDPQGTTLEAVEISAEAANERITSTDMGLSTLTMAEVKKLPVLFGETDVLKTIQLLPGIQAAGEGSSGFYVRGGGADQNLILLDEAPVYNPSHLMGFFSVFNGDAIKSTKVYKGNMPAEYGGRLSSALDVRMKDGNSKDYALSGGIGLISSRLTFEGPIVEDQGSFMISGRRTYADLFLNFSSDSNLSNSQLYFYDLNLKANYRLGEKDQLFLSGYFGRDKFGFQDQFGIDWGNATATLRWNHLFNDKLFLNSTLIYSDYDYSIGFNAAGVEIKSGIRDFNLKEDFSWYANSNNELKFGVNAIYHTFVPGIILSSEESNIPDSELPERYALESAAYVSHEWAPSRQFKVNYGLRASMFTVLGPGTFYQYNTEGTIIDSSMYDQGEIVENYMGLEPRISANYIINANQSVKAAYSRNRQYIHLLSNATASTPTDLWIPSSEIVQPEIADQFSVGYFHNFAENTYEASVELYYKELQNQIEYRSGADIFLNENIESQLVFGDGWSYGAEFLFRKNTGKLTGWVAYTWSRTWRQFEQINEGAAFPAKQDRIHDLSLVLVYEPNPKWSFSGTWVYQTGNAVTFPSGSYIVNGNLVPLYTERNGYRMPDYHRLDLSATWYGKNPRSNWNVSIYNAYNRKNAYSIDFQESESNPGSLEATKTYLFGIVPSVSWNFNF